MEPQKIEGTGDLDWTEARLATEAILKAIAAAGFTAPEDTDRHVIRVQVIATQMDRLVAALKITNPSADTAMALLRERSEVAAALGAENPLGNTHTAMLTRARWLNNKIEQQRLTERRHRDQRLKICEALGIQWDGEIKAQLDARQLADRGRLAGIHGLLAAAGLTTSTDDPLDPTDVVRRLVEERNEMLAEMALGVEPEKLAEAVAGEPASNQPRIGCCASCNERLCARGHCHSVEGSRDASGVALHTGCVLATPSCESQDGTADILPGALRIVHEALISVIATSERDWSRSADLAWLYGVIIGWSALDFEALRVSFGWGVGVVQVIQEHRAALVCAGIVEL